MRIPANGMLYWSRPIFILIFTLLIRRQIMQRKSSIPGMRFLTVSHSIFHLSEAAKLFTLCIAIFTHSQRMAVNQKIQEVFL